MITLYRRIRIWMFKTKWELALWQFINQQMMELIKNPEKIEEKFMPYLSKLIHDTANKAND